MIKCAIVKRKVTIAKHFHKTVKADDDKYIAHRGDVLIDINSTYFKKLEKMEDHFECFQIES